MSNEGEPFIPAGTSKQATENWHELLSQLPKELLVTADIHELELLYRLLALSEALSKKMETDSSDLKSGRMLEQVQEIVNRIRDGDGLNPIEPTNVELKPVDGKGNSEAE